MAIKFNDAVIASIAIDKIKDNLLAAQTATQGAIIIGRNILGGDFLDKTIFDALLDAEKRDPNSDTPLTAKRLGTSTYTDVKMYYKNPHFITNTELERYGSNFEAMQVGIAEALAESVTRYILSMGIAGLVAAIESAAALSHTAAAKIKSEDLVGGIFKFGDAAQDIKVFVAPSTAVMSLMVDGANATSSSIAYGAVYDGTVGTLSRALWTVDSPALLNGAKAKVLGLATGALVIDESEVVKMITNLNTANENTGYDLRPEGAYTAKVKGFSWKKTSGANPDLATIGASANWELKSQPKSSAGVIILEA